MDMVLTNRWINAQQADAWGLVSRVVPADKLMDEALAVAAKINGLGQISVMAAKEAVNRAFESSLSDGLWYERRLFHAMFGTADQREGMAAFLDKRPPKFERPG
jgi:enoyl-CoA hydratase